jgi:hypothetical protein
MKAIASTGRSVRNELERVSTVKGYYLGYECDGTEQVFGLMTAEDEPTMTVDDATFWSRYIYDHFKEVVVLTLGPIVVPSSPEDVVKGVRRILSSRSVDFGEEAGGETTDFEIREVRRLTCEDIYELMYLLQQEYRNSGIAISLFVYVAND